MYCANCGGALQSGARFCTACGTPVAPAAGAPAATAAPVTAAPSLSRRSAGSLLLPPPPPEPPRSRPGLIPAIVTAAIILAAGLGVGIYFGVTSGGPATQTASTNSATVARGSTTIAPTTTTQTSAPATTTSLATTTSSADHDDRRRDGGPGTASGRLDGSPRVDPGDRSGHDRADRGVPHTQRPGSGAGRKYQTDWSEPADPADIIETDFWDTIAQVMVEPDGSRAVTVATLRLGCRDGLTTRGLEALAWQKEGGEWLRTVSYEPLSPAEGPLVPFGGAVRSGDLLWSPVTLHELKHLGVGEGPTAPGMFVTVEFFVRNEGQNDVTPGGWQITAVDASGTEYGLSSTADEWWYGDVEDRAIPLLPGESTYLWLTFEVPDGLDLQNAQFRVMMPTL